MTQRLPLRDKQRKKSRDNRLWQREQHRATLYPGALFHCPCKDCKGVDKSNIRQIYRHLIRRGRFGQCRVWRGSGDVDSSDGEWEEAFRSGSLPIDSDDDIRDNQALPVQTDSSSRLDTSDFNIDADHELDGGMQVEPMVDNVVAFFKNEQMVSEVCMEALENSDTIMDDNGRQACGQEDVCDDLVDDILGITVENASTPNGEWDTSPLVSPKEHRGMLNNDDRDEEERRQEHLRNMDALALQAALKKLYPNAKNTMLSAVIAVLNLVSTHPGMTSKCGDDIFAIIKWLLPEGNHLPSNMYQAKRLCRRLGLDFQSIHACPRGCVLYRLSMANLKNCPVCNEERYKDNRNCIGPLKVLRHFPLIPRLQRFYRTPVLAKLMRWWKENRSTDGKVRYPADTEAWQHLDSLTMEKDGIDTKDFGRQVQDVRIQVSADGICPFKLHRSTWSAWPVLITLLNLPPWLATRKFFMLLSLLIPGREQVPFEKFDVFLQPLMEELQQLWVGVPGFDCREEKGKEGFLLRAAVLYTTHDFPGYGTVAGASHQGYCACPPCGNQLRGRYSKELGKFVYRDARRWVQMNHHLQRRDMDYLFDGVNEERSIPTPKTVAEQMSTLKEYQEWLRKSKRRVSTETTFSKQSKLCDDQIQQHDGPEDRELNENSSIPCDVGGLRQSSSMRLSTKSVASGSGSTGPLLEEGPNSEHGHTSWTKSSGKSSNLNASKIKTKRPPDPSKTHGMKRKSSFCCLPYWKHLKITYTLDPMHCEKNIAENILKTICGQKEKDSVKVRRDMQREGIRKQWWLTRNPRNPSKMVKPAASYVLTAEEFDKFCTRLEKLKVPSNYCSELGTAIRNRKWGALKSHDYHVLLQCFIPYALRGLMDQNTRTAIMRLSRVFRRICCKTWNPQQLPNLREDVAVTMSMMDMTFPPSFFDIMSHMPMHLVEELGICGPVHVRWMYPVERNMKALKGHVKNRARPEASISHGYLVDETMGFITEFLHGFKPVTRRVWDLDPEDANEFEVLEGGFQTFQLTRAQRDSAHSYVLRNNTLTAPYYNKWKAESGSSGGEVLPMEQWVHEAIVCDNLRMTDTSESDTVYLANYPSMTAKRYARIKAYGYHWRVVDGEGRSESMGTYDSGVACPGMHENSEGPGEDFVGELQDIVLMNYGPLSTPIILFFCQWKKRRDNRNNETYVRDKDGFLCVNWKQNVPKNKDPFVFPSQCTQVFFGDDDLRPTGDWKVVLPRDARSRRVVQDDDDVFMSTNNLPEGLAPPHTFQKPPEEPVLVGAIALTDADNAIAFQSYENKEQGLTATKKKRIQVGQGKKRKRFVSAAKKQT